MTTQPGEEAVDDVDAHEVDAAADFEEHRRHLFAVAYRLLGSVVDAEDAVQECWLRWDVADRTLIDRPLAWLTTVVSRIGIDRLRSAQVRRESYVGPWLPEPLLANESDPAEHAVLAESLSLAFLTLLERLDPVERAAFLLREVFAEDYDMVAAAIDRSEVATRQIVHRAKSRLEPDRPARFEADPTDERRLIDSFLAASLLGDLDTLHEVLADDVVAWGDGGPAQHAARKPIIGRHRVALFCKGIGNKRPGLAGEMAILHQRVNGEPGVVVTIDREVYMVMAFDVTPDGIRAVRSILNPDKLEHLQPVVARLLEKLNDPSAV